MLSGGDGILARQEQLGTIGIRKTRNFIVYNQTFAYNAKSIDISLPQEL